MTGREKPIANPLLVLREEFDDWAILFDPDTGNAFGLNPTTVFVWKRLDGNHSLDDILKDLKASCDDVPADAEEHIKEFVQDIVEKGYAGFELKSA
jgi:SynChlorMet cassette protein ScmD